MEAETYLTSGHGIRLAIQVRRMKWQPLGNIARIWQPSRLKGIQVSPEFGTGFLAAGQLFDVRPVVRKWLSLERTEDSALRYVAPGTVLVTCSGNVGRATLAQKVHEKLLISHDLLRVEAKDGADRGWIYALLRAPKTRAMMTSAQYGHIIKHLEVAHLAAIPSVVISDEARLAFNEALDQIQADRDRAFDLFTQAEERFAGAIGKMGLPTTTDSHMFSIAASSIFPRRRRLEGAYYNPKVQRLYAHFAAGGFSTEALQDCGFEISLPTRFKRIPAADGIPLLDSSDLFEVNPDVTKRIANEGFGDIHSGQVKAGWLLMARSGQVYGIIGSLAIATTAHEEQVISDHVIRIRPNEAGAARVGYICTALSHPTLGRPLVKALAYGSSIPELDPTDVRQLRVVRLGAEIENNIADLAEDAADAMARADLREREIAVEADRLIDNVIRGHDEVVRRAHLSVMPGVGDVTTSQPADTADQQSFSASSQYEDIDWLPGLYDLVASEAHMEAIDRIYERVEAELTTDTKRADRVLRELNPDRLSPEELVAVLIATLEAKNHLPSRQSFIARSRPILDREGEGADEILRGLE